jgi:hypothetical protein
MRRAGMGLHTSGRGSSWVGLVLVTAVLALPSPSAGRAEAAFPGANGKIAFGTARDGNTEVYAMNPDGSGPVNLTNNTAIDGDPGTFSRERFQRLDFSSDDVVDAPMHGEEVRLNTKGRTMAVEPLDLEDHPDLEELIAAASSELG